ncbi:MAG TPA: hypothetical protein DCM28_22885 [Phycisphaerales bacterium]|nr:hypothetical protein [Phycisphaerales bacterium]HCD31513.1 hypothetical protein [Phycisphaerales bacterium]|tara:strand:+ start:109 stop:456 length:348 start_codon:yes stop_codon:yes gene_type:complete
MHPFEQTISIVGPIVVSIIVLTLFFKFMSWIVSQSKGKETPRNITLTGILDKNTSATIHVGSSQCFENVRIIGFTDSASFKDAFPHSMHGMLILEHQDGRRILIQAKNVRMIELS